MGSRARMALAAVVLIAAFGVYRLWNTPERQIRQTLNGVAAVMSHEQPDSGLTAAAAVTSLQTYLAPDIVIDTGRAFGVLKGSPDVVANAARLRLMTSMMRVEFVDVQVSMTGETSATVHATVKITTQGRSGAAVVDAREINASFTRIEGRWVIVSVDQIPVLEPVT